MEVRRALMDEIEEVVALGQRGHADSENRKYEFDEGRAKLLVAHCITSERAVALVAIKADRIVGFLLGKEDEYGYINMRYATDLAIYSEEPGAGRRLIERFEQWAFFVRKVDQMILAVSHGGKSAHGVDALYQRLGYEHVGGLFTKQRHA